MRVPSCWPPRAPDHTARPRPRDRKPISNESAPPSGRALDDLGAGLEGAEVGHEGREARGRARAPRASASGRSSGACGAGRLRDTAGGRCAIDLRDAGQRRVRRGLDTGNVLADRCPLRVEFVHEEHEPREPGLQAAQQGRHPLDPHQTVDAHLRRGGPRRSAAPSPSRAHVLHREQLQVPQCPRRTASADMRRRSRAERVALRYRQVRARRRARTGRTAGAPRARC